ncbi:MAG: exodeoxyribonuclease VII large subunit [Defluviitaleaceae bacterium]|nr:exodeoxyribonuclease VII large subunit [Defluviitaleaceae bacterium]
MTKTIFTVAQVNRYVKKALDTDALLAGLFVEGEISNFNAHSSGHFYFTLKDAGAAIPAVMFASHTEVINFVPKSGMKVIAFGRVSVYEKTGQYQLYVEFLEPAGIGGLQLAFAQLKEKLEAEGLFSRERKREIPRFAKTVAVITSPTGAAVQDILKIIRERNRAVKIIVAPAIVQGEHAAPDIVRALSEVNSHGEADVIILGRGGGSVEDLRAFNEESVARAIGASKIPVISAVGHETDFTIADFVADLRAPTPTAAAQIAAFDHAAVSAHLRELQADLMHALAEKLRENFDTTKFLLANLTRAITERLADNRKTLAHREILLEKVSPYAVFKRGFALVRLARNEENAISSVKQLSPGQTVKITYADGAAIAKIISAGEDV